MADSNQFAFLRREWPDIYDAAARAESLADPDPRTARLFARRVTTVEKIKTAHRAHLAELDALFASLQHRAFHGEL